MFLQKLDEDAVSKYALQNEVPTAAILNSVDITTETRARARLAGHKLIVDAVQSFRNKFPDWKSSITELLNNLGAKHRAKKQANRKKKDVKVKKDRKTKTVKEDDEQNLESSKTHSEFENSLVNESDSDKSGTIMDKNLDEKTQTKKILPVENNTSFKNEINKSKTKENISKNICNISEKSQQINKMNALLTEEPELVNKLQPENSLSIKLDITNIELEKKLTKRKSEQIIPCKVVDKKKRIMVDDIKPLFKTVDSFFMTADDKDYMSVYKPQPLVEKIPTEHSKLVDVQKPKEIFVKGKKVAVIKTKINHAGNRRERRQQQVEEPVDTALHPSWEAKRKQKSLAKFEGKKITFDDED